MKLVTRVINIFESINDALAIVAGGLIAFAMLLVGADVTMRYLLNRPIPNVLEITEHLLLFITFLSAAWVLQRGGHVAVEIVLNRLNPRNQALVSLIISTVCATSCLVLTWYGTWVTSDYFVRGIRFAGILAIPQAPILAIIPLSFFLLFIQFLRRSYGHLRSLRAW